METKLILELQKLMEEYREEMKEFREEVKEFREEWKSQSLTFFDDGAGDDDSHFSNPIDDGDPDDDFSCDNSEVPAGSEIGEDENGSNVYETDVVLKEAIEPAERRNQQTNQFLTSEIQSLKQQQASGVNSVNPAEFERRMTSETGNNNLYRNLNCNPKLEFPTFEVFTTIASETFDESSKKEELKVEKLDIGLDIDDVVFAIGPWIKLVWLELHNSEATTVREVNVLIFDPGGGTLYLVTPNYASFGYLLYLLLWINGRQPVGKTIRRLWFPLKIHAMAVFAFIYCLSVFLNFKTWFSERIDFYQAFDYDLDASVLRNVWEPLAILVVIQLYSFDTMGLQETLVRGIYAYGFKKLSVIMKFDPSHDWGEKPRYKRYKFFGKSTEKMVVFLQGLVGIIHKNHAASVTASDHNSTGVHEGMHLCMKKEDPLSLGVAAEYRKAVVKLGGVSHGACDYIVVGHFVHGNEVSHWVPKRVNGPLEGHGDRRIILKPREVDSLKGLCTVQAAYGVWHTFAVVEVMVGN